MGERLLLLLGLDAWGKMSVQICVRCTVALFFAMMVSGCSLLGFGGDDTDRPGGVNECQINRSSCMYEGPYEPDERGYAEEEAKRLNEAAFQRLRRSGVH